MKHLTLVIALFLVGFAGETLAKRYSDAELVAIALFSEDASGQPWWTVR